MKINIDLTWSAIFIMLNIILKTTGVVNWSWWIVLWPVWFDIVAILVLILLIGKRP